MRAAISIIATGATSDEETLSLLGRVHKELWRRAADPALAADAIKQACKFYGDAFALRDAYYPGINLAFTLAAAFTSTPSTLRLADSSTKSTSTWSLSR